MLEGVASQLHHENLSPKRIYDPNSVRLPRASFMTRHCFAYLIRRISLEGRQLVFPEGHPLKILDGAGLGSDVVEDGGVLHSLTMPRQIVASISGDLQIRRW